MPVVKGGGVARKAATAEEIARADAAIAKKKRDRRSALRRFVDNLPAYWRALNENNTSLYLFHERSRVRRAAWRLIRWPWFDRVIMLAIVINCATLAMFDPTQPPDSTWNQTLDSVELVFTFVFFAEFFVQIVARNFLIGPGAYLKNPWFAFDFVIVVSGLIGLVGTLVGMGGGGNLSGVRAFRALKPLRTITGVPGMRVIVVTVLDSMKLVASASVILLWLAFVFGVVGIDQFAGELTRRCYADERAVGIVREEWNLPCDAFGRGGRACGAREFCLDSGAAPNRGHTSFDDIFGASLVIFQTMTRRGWGEVMEQVGDATGSVVFARVFFCSMVVFASYFAASLVSSVVVAEYAKTSVLEEKTGQESANKDLERFRRRLIRQAWFVRTKRWFLSKWSYQAPARRLAEHPRFETFVALLILANTAVMAAEYHGMDATYAAALESLNALFTLAFAGEMMLKIAGLGIVEYVSDAFNRFDAAIVIVGLVELLTRDGALSVLRAFRLARVFRTVRLLRSSKRMRHVVEKIALGAGALRDFVLVLVLFVFIFAVLGMQLFGGTRAFAGERKHFDDVWHASLLVFEMLTASEWQVAMFRGMDALGPGAAAYFTAWMFVGHFIFLALLLAIMCFTFSRETEDERLAREEKERLAEIHLMGERGGEKRLGLADVAGGDLVLDRVVRRKNNIFAKQAADMKAWLRETDQMYGEDQLTDSDEDFENDPYEKYLARDRDEPSPGGKKAKKKPDEGGSGSESDAPGSDAGEDGPDSEHPRKKEDDSDHDDGDDGAPEAAFSLVRTDPRASLAATVKGGVAVPASVEQMEEAAKRTVRVHGSRRPLDAFRKAAEAAILARRFAGDGWKDGGGGGAGFSAGGGAGLSGFSAAARDPGGSSDPSALDLDKLTGKELEDAVLRRDEERKKAARRRRVSMVSRMLAKTKTKQQLAEEEAAAQAASGDDRSTTLLDDAFDERSDGHQPTRGRRGGDDVLGEIMNDSLRRAEASGKLTRESLAKLAGFDETAFAEDDALGRAEREQRERDSAVGSDRASSLGTRSVSGTSYRDDRAGWGGFAAMREASASLASERASSRGDFGYAEDSRFGGIAPNVASEMARSEAIVRARQGPGTGTYQGEGVDPEVAETLRAMGVSDGIKRGARSESAAAANAASAFSSPDAGRRDTSGRAAATAAASTSSPSRDLLPPSAASAARRAGRRARAASSRRRRGLSAEVGGGAEFDGDDADEAASRGLHEAPHDAPAPSTLPAAPALPATPTKPLAGDAVESAAARAAGGLSPFDPRHPASAAKSSRRAKYDAAIRAALAEASLGGSLLSADANPPSFPSRDAGGSRSARARALGLGGGDQKLSLAEQLAAFGSRANANANATRKEKAKERAGQLGSAGPVTESYDVAADEDAFFDAAFERAFAPRPGPVTESTDPSVRGDADASPLFDRMTAARARGASSRNVALAGEASGRGRAFAALMAGGAARAAREMGAGGEDDGSAAPVSSARDPRVPSLDLRGDGAGEDARSTFAASPFERENSNPTSRLAMDMMRRLDERRSKKTLIPPVTDSAQFLPPATEDFALSLLGTQQRGMKRRGDGVPDRDVVVSAPIRLKDRPKFSRAEEGSENQLGGAEPPPVFMKHRSLWVFSPQSAFRRVAFMVAFDKSFEAGVLACILLSSAALAVDDPTVKPGSALGLGLGYLDLALTVVFFCEMCVKLIAMGFAMHPGAYLRDAWNALDFVTVCSSVAALAFRDPSLVVVRSFRALRALRPLRMVRRLRGMRLVMATLVRSFPHVANVAVFGAFLFVVFGVLGVQLFAGTFWRCTDPSVAGVAECFGAFSDPATGHSEARAWVNAVLNFDHIGNAMLTLFVVSTRDRWFDVALDAMDATEAGRQPAAGSNPAAALFFVAFVILAGMFWVNVLVAAVIDSYRKISAATGEMVFETSGQKNWAEALKMKQRQNLDAEALRAEEPKFFIRKYLHRFVRWRLFELFVVLCIAVNVLMMVTEHEGEPATLTGARTSANEFFAWVFILELVFKVIAFTPRGYLRDPWNRFDALVVAGSVPGIFGASVGPGATLLRTFRLGRLFKLVKDAAGLRALFTALVNSLGALANVGSLLFLHVFIFAVLGMNLFGELERGERVNDAVNFETFGNAILTLFRVMSGDDWAGVMIDTFGCEVVRVGDESYGGARVGAALAASCEIPAAPPIFFVAFYLGASTILINLFVAVMLDEFVDAAQSEGIMSTASFFDLLQRKMLLDGFVDALKKRLEENRARLGLDKKGGRKR